MSMINDTQRRINITLPDQTLQQIDRATDHGNRSRLIDAAVNFYLGHQKRANLHNELHEGAVVRAKRDLECAIELFTMTESWETRQA